MAQLLVDPDTLEGSSDADDYDIIEEIGRGGDGTVYLATDLKVNRQVALKLLGNLHLISPSTLQRFQAEADAIASLDHPNIIHIFAFGELDSRPFYTMKYIDGGNLSTRLDDFKSPSAIAQLIRRIARGIHHAHERGILHRDLKPSNILIDQAGSPYISDFGLSKRPSENLHLTLTGSIMGTPAFMSPEQARGDNALITTATDIFSIGTIFFQLLTGRLPFTGENPPAVLLQVIEKDPDFTSDFRQSHDRDLKTICLKCLHKDPEQRYETALALVHDLERWEKGEPVLARRISPTERALRWMRRHPFALVALITLILGLVTSTVLWRHAENERSRADKLALSESTARVAAEENNYYSTLSNALSARKDLDFGRARTLLDSTRPEYRGFEWNLLKGLCHGDQLSSTPLASKPVHLSYDSFHRRILLLTEDRQIHQFDPDQNQLTLLASLPANPIPPTKTPYTFPGLRRLSFSPDGRHYLFVEDNHFHVVDHATNQITHSGKAPTDGDAQWLDANTILSASGPVYSHLDRKTGKLTVTAWLTKLDEGTIALPKHGLGAPFTLSPDGSYIAFTLTNSSIAFYPRSQGFDEEPEHTIKLRYYIQSMAFSPDGRYFHTTSGPSDTTFHLFDFPKREQLFAKDWQSSSTVLPHPLHPGRFILMGRDPWFTTWDPFLKIKNPATNQAPVPPPEGFLSRKFHTGTPEFHFGHDTAVLTSLIPPGADYFLTASADQTLRKWPFAPNSTNLKPRGKFDTSYSRIHPTASHNGDYVLFGIGEKAPPEYCSSHLWHRPSDETIDLPEGQTYLAVLNDGRVFTRVIATGQVIAWQFSPSEQLKELWRADAPGLLPSLEEVVHSSVSPDERIISVLHIARAITINTVTQAVSVENNQDYFGGSTPGQSISISPDARFIVITGFKGITPHVYEVGKLENGPRTLIPAVPYSTNDSVCIFSGDGEKIYVGNDDGMVRVYDTATLRELPDEAWRAHSSELTAIAVSQKGDVIATAGGIETTLWSTRKKEGQERRRRLRIETGLPSRNWIQFTGNDTQLLHSAPRSDLEIWEAPKE